MTRDDKLYYRALVEEIIADTPWMGYRPRFTRWNRCRGYARRGGTFSLGSWVTGSPEWLVGIVLHEMAHHKAGLRELHNSYYQKVEKDLCQKWGLAILRNPRSSNGYALAYRFAGDTDWTGKPEAWYR